MNTLLINSSVTTSLNPTLPSPHSSSITPTLRLPHTPFTRKTLTKFAIKASSNDPTPSNNRNPSISPLKTAAAALIFAVAAFGKFPHLPAKADISSPTQTLTEELRDEDIQLEKQDEVKQNTPLTHLLESNSEEFPHLPAKADISSPTQTLTEELRDENIQLEKQDEVKQNTPLTHLLESNSEAVEALKKLLQEKLESGEDEESISILSKLSSTQPENLEWKFLIARVLNEMGKLQETRDTFEGVLAKTPLSFEALFENALLMDKSGEGDAVMRRLEEALAIAEKEMKVKEARDVKLIMAQMQFLHKNVDKALRSYDELVQEDPSDFRPYFCKGMIYSLMDKNVEAREQFAKYRELSPKKFDVEGYLRTPLSRMKLFGTEEDN